jgi:hypothetical protein
MSEFPTVARFIGTPTGYCSCGHMFVGHDRREGYHCKQCACPCYDGPRTVYSYVWSVAGVEDFAATFFSAVGDKNAIEAAQAMAQDTLRDLGRTSVDIQVRRVEVSEPFHVGAVELEPVNPGDRPSTLARRRAP